MKKAVALAIVGIVVTVGLFASSASALPPFKTAFEKKYVADGSADFKAAEKAAGCNVCHVKDKDKKVRNDYGKALSKIIGGTAAADLKEAGNQGDDAKKAKLAELLKKLDEAFTQVEGEKSPSGETFGEKIKAGKLPN